MIVPTFTIVIIIILQIIWTRLDIRFDKDPENDNEVYLWYTPIFGKRTIRKYIKLKRNVH